MANGTSIYTWEVQAKVNTKDFNRGAKELENKAKAAGEKIQIKPKVAGKPTAEMKQLIAATKQAEKELDSLNRKREQARKRHTTSTEYKDFAKTVNAAEKEIDEMIAKQEAWASLGPSVINSKHFQDLDAQIERAREHLQDLYNTQKAMQEYGSTDAQEDEWHELNSAIDAAENQVKEFHAAQKQLIDSGGAYEGIKTRIQSLRDELQKCKESARASSAPVKTFFKGLSKEARKHIPVSLRLLAKFGKEMAKLPFTLLTIRKHLGGTSKSLGQLKKGLFIGAGLKPLARLAALGGGVYLAIRGVGEGMKNLVQYSDETNRSVSMLYSSLIQLKNAMATAFAPILNAIAPALNSLINMLTRAATAVAHFTAAFTGKSTVVVAKKVTADYGATLDTTAKSAGGATKALKEYENQLLGFDQINKLENPADSGTGSGSGGGAGGAGGLSPGDMFETVDVSSGAKSLVDRIKDAWKKGDFTELGVDLGNKINTALSKIPWRKIKKTAKKIGKSVATFLNGAIKTTDWKLVGKTIAEGLNTGIALIGTFLATFDFKAAGKALGHTISGLIEKVDWEGIGKGISDLLTGAIEFAQTALSNINWEGLGKGIIKTIENIDVVKILQDVVELAGTVLMIPFRLASGAVEEVTGQSSEDALKETEDNLDIWKSFQTGEHGSVRLTASITALDDSLLTPQQRQIKNLVALFNSSGKEASFSSKVSGMTASFIDWSKGTPFESLVTGMVAQLSDKTKKQGFNNWLTGIKAELSTKKKKQGFNNWLTGIKAELSTKKKKKGFDNWLNLKASLTDRAKARGFNSWLDFKAQISEVSLTDRAKRTFYNLQYSKNPYKAGGGLFKNGRWQPITAAAAGGYFNQGQVFIAREAGPELVGRIGGGTGVMNNDQIVSSVAAGVAEAVAATLGSGKQSVNVYLQGDASQLFKVVRVEAQDYLNATGQSPFPV